MAQGIYTGTFTPSDNEMIVLEGGYLMREDRTNKPNTVRNRQRVVTLKSKPHDGKTRVLIEDVSFTSPALAAAVMLGKEMTGGHVWKTGQGQSFNEIKQQVERGELPQRNDGSSEKIKHKKQNEPVKNTTETLEASEHEHEQQIKQLLSRRHLEEMDRDVTSIVYVDDNPTADALIKDIEHQPEALFIGMLMDRRIKAERAWSIPYIILSHYGTLSFEKLKDVPLDEWIAFFNRNHLHIDNKGMAKVLYLAIKKVNSEYAGDPSNLWKSETDASRLVQRFQEFHGVGDKLGTMIVNILLRDFKFPFNNLLGIDISPDIQVVKVFHRLGLIPKESKTDTIRKARTMNPDFPGIFDLGAWEIGRDYCKPSSPLCTQCPLSNYCDYASGKH